MASQSPRATLNIVNSALVTIADEEFISVSGQLNITNASVVIAKNAGCCSDGIVVNNGGAIECEQFLVLPLRQQRL